MQTYTQKQYHRSMYTYPTIGLLLIGIALIISIIFIASIGIPWTIWLYSCSLPLVVVWYYVSEVHQYKNSVWTEPKTYEEACGNKS